MPDSADGYDRNFADYYDKITAHKDYAAEVARLAEVIRAAGVPPRARLLDVGCGTGGHAIRLAAMGYGVTAIDLSPHMIRVAQAKDTPVAFACADIATFPETGFDFAYSLFNVINCLDTLEALEGFLAAIAARLAPGATLLVEGWNPVAVIAEPPVVVRREFEAEGERISRTATPRPDLLRQRLDLEYSLAIAPAGAAAPERSFEVVHRLRLFTPLEVEYCLRRAGFVDVGLFTALPDLIEAKADDRMLAFVAKLA